MLDIIFIILPLILIGITFVLFIRNYNTQKLSINAKNQQINKDISTNYMSLVISFFICFGIFISSFFIDKIGIICISYGICFGVLCSILICSLIKK